MGVLAMLFHRHMEHLGGRGTVNVPALGKNLLTPLLPSEPSNDTRLDCGEVGHDELSAVLRHKGGADKLGQSVRYILVEHLHGVEVPRAHHRAGLGQIGQMVLGQVL